MLGIAGGRRTTDGFHALAKNTRKPPDAAGSYWAVGLAIAEVAELARHANAGVTATMYAGLSETGRARVTRRLVESGFGGEDPWPVWPVPALHRVLSRCNTRA